jgi:VanZ family protein
MGPAALPWTLTRRQGFRLALAGCLIAITVLALIPPGHEPVGSADKVNHFAAFLVLAWLADHAYPGYSFRPEPWMALLGYGLLIEVLQAFLPYREASLGDLVADGAGLLAYLALRRTRLGRQRRSRARAQL